VSSCSTRTCSFARRRAASDCHVKRASSWKTTATTCNYSAASIWEIAIKSSLRRKDFRIDLHQLLATLPEMDLVELPITAAHAAGVTGLPAIHRDPFDRLLIAQSITEPLTLLTNDALLERYRVGARVV
jgi:PIN domain nuclease of toxin-antitoxin system